MNGDTPMLRLNIFLTSTTLMLLPLGCRESFPGEIIAGTYALRSAFLNQNGRLRELNCQGDFKIILSKADLQINLQAVGEANCAASHPSSFVEHLGGTCSLPSFALSETQEEESFSTSGHAVACNHAESANTNLSIQVTGEKAFRIVRQGQSILNSTRSEIIFERISNAL